MAALEPHIRALATTSTQGLELALLRRDAVKALIGEVFVASDDGSWRTRPMLVAAEQDKLSSCGGGI